MTLAVVRSMESPPDPPTTHTIPHTDNRIPGTTNKPARWPLMTMARITVKHGHR
ncbi:hypothetical protein D3C85_1287690 [compost metagenome]